MCGDCFGISRRDTISRSENTYPASQFYMWRCRIGHEICGEIHTGNYTFTTPSLPAVLTRYGRANKAQRSQRTMNPGMNPRERANWFDTEGNLHASPVERPLRDSIVTMCVSQQDRVSLDAFAAGLHRNGIECRIKTEAGNGQGFRLSISRMEDIARELALELPFIRNQKRLNQICNFAEFVRRERLAARQTALKTLHIVTNLKLPPVANRRAMNSLDRANWFEAEGCLSSRLDEGLAGAGAQFIVQAESSPLQYFADGCLGDGTESKLYSRVTQNGIEHIVRIRRLDHIALEVCKELP